MKKQFLLIITLTAFVTGSDTIRAAATSGSSLSDDYDSHDNESKNERPLDAKRTTRAQDVSDDYGPTEAIKRARSLAYPATSSSNNVYNPSLALARKEYRQPLAPRTLPTLLSLLTRANIRNILADKQNIPAFESREAFEAAKSGFGLSFADTESILPDITHEYALYLLKEYVAHQYALYLRGKGKGLNMPFIRPPSWLKRYFTGFSMQDIYDSFKPPLRERIRLSFLGKNISDLDGIQNFSLAESLDFAFNQISHINPGSFAGFTMLKYLFLNHNTINSLDADAFAGLNALEALSLSDNLIKTIDPEAFKGLDKLAILSLANNELTDIPTDIFATMPRLQKLELNGNNIPESEQARIQAAAGPDVEIKWE